MVSKQVICFNYRIEATELVQSAPSIHCDTEVRILYLQYFYMVMSTISDITNIGLLSFLILINHIGLYLPP